MRAMIRKEFAQLRRDHRTVAMLVLIPVVLLVVFGFAARFELTSARTVVLGTTADAVAAQLPEVFDVQRVGPGTRATGIEQLRNEGVDVVVLADEGQVLLDGTQLFAAQAVQRALGAATAPLPLTAADVQILFNPELATPTIMVPALVGLILLFIGALATSLGVVREREAGTLEQLAVMPLSPIDVFVGKLAPYLLIAVVDLVVIVATGLLLFNVPFNGSWALFASGATVFLFVALALGVVISTLSENQGQAVQLSLMVLLPQIMLSGLIFPVAAMATPLQWVSAALPLTWFNQLARGIMIRGAGLGQVARPFVVLLVMAAVVSTIAVRRFARELAPESL